MGTPPGSPEPDPPATIEEELAYLRTPSAGLGRGPGLLLVVVVVVLVVGLAAGFGGIQYGRQTEDAHWTPIYRQATTQLADSKARANELNSLLGQLQDKVKATVGDLDQPSFVLWNSCSANLAAGCPLRPGYFYVGGVPDTFTYEVNLTATVPVTVMIMSTRDFACWDTSSCVSHWVEWRNRTELLRGTFHDAEGCAAYLAVFQSQQAGTLYPNIRVTRNPAAQATGVCA